MTINDGLYAAPHLEPFQWENWVHLTREFWECLLVTHSDGDLSHNCSILFLAEAFPKSSKKGFSSSNWAHLRDIDP